MVPLADSSLTPARRNERPMRVTPFLLSVGSWPQPVAGHEDFILRGALNAGRSSPRIPNSLEKRRFLESQRKGRPLSLILGPLPCTDG